MTPRLTAPLLIAVLGTFTAVVLVGGEDAPKRPTLKDIGAGGRCWCKMPNHPPPPPPEGVAPRLSTVTEIEPNNTPGAAQLVPLGTGVGLDDTLVISGTITPNSDQDCYRFTAKRGDVIGFAMNSQFDTVGEILDATGAVLIDNDDLNGLPFIYPKTSPMPLPLNPKLDLNSAISMVLPADGDYIVRVGSYLQQSGNTYQLQLVKKRPFIETQDLNAKQVLFLDFDGATINPQVLFGDGNTSADMSPFRNFMTAWGLTAADENLIIDRVVAQVKAKFDLLRQPALNGDRPADGIPGHFDIEIRNSRDHVDTFGQPFVSRVIIGGTVSETGVDTVGIASSVDPGNFDAQDTAIVLMDYISEPAGGVYSVNSLLLGGGVTKVDAVATTLTNLITHEAGHFLGNFHTDSANNRMASTMDTGGTSIQQLAGAGGDQILGTADDVNVRYIGDNFEPTEGTTITPTIEPTDYNTAMGCSTGTVNTGSGGGGAGGGGIIVLRPDLFIKDVTFNTTPLVAGAAFAASVVIGNKGSAPAGDFQIAAFLNQTTIVPDGNGAVTTQIVNGVPTAQTKTVDVYVTYPLPGEFTLALLVDSSNLLAESSESNNMFFKSVVIFAQGVDLVVTDVKVTQSNPGIDANFEVTIQNRGLATSSAFQVGFYPNQGTPPTTADVPTATVDVPSLALGAFATVPFTLPTQTTPRGGFAWFYADRANAQIEDLETNNIKQAGWGIANDPFVITSPLAANTKIAGIGEQVKYSIGVTDPNGDPISYFWDYGDGVTGYGAANVSHAYNAEGFFTTKVTVSDGPFHSQTSSTTVEVVRDLIDLGTVRLSVNRGRFRLTLPRPTGFLPSDRLKSYIVDGFPGDRARYRNFRLSGIATVKGTFLFLVEFQSKSTFQIRRVRYRYTVID